MADITIAHVHDFLVDGKVILPDHAVYIGREVRRYRLKRSPLANPWRVGKLSHIGSGSFFGAHAKRVWVPKGNLTRQDAVRLCRESMEVSLWHQHHTVIDELARHRALLAEHDRLLYICWCGSEHLEGTCWCAETHEAAYRTGKWPCHGELIRDVLLEDARC